MFLTKGKWPECSLTLHLLFSQDEKVNSLLIISNYNMNDNKNYTAPGCSDLTSLLLTAA